MADDNSMAIFVPAVADRWNSAGPGRSHGGAARVLPT